MNKRLALDLIGLGLFLLTISMFSACDQHTGEQDDHADHEHEDRDVHDKHDEQAGHVQKDCEHDLHNTHDEHEDEHEDHDEHDAHDHGAGEDLNKSVEELFAAECEHDVKTHACDECRYEVGVVKVAQNLIEQGLVKVRKVENRNFDTEIALTGEIAFDERKVVHLSPRVSGIVTRVSVDLGQSVKTGQKLVVLESIELAEAQAAYLEALAETQLAQKTFQRQQTLRKRNITSEREFLETEQSFEAAKIRSNAARQKLLRLGLSSSTINRLERGGLSAATGTLTVSAPFAGEVLQLQAARGEQIDPGAEMLLLGDTRSLWVWVNLYESQLSQVKQALDENGIPVTVSVRSYPNETFSGRLNFVGRVMDEHTRTVKARVGIDNSDGKLKPGMFAKVSLGLDAARGKPAIPETAVLSDEGRDFVFVHHEDDYFIRRPVTKGRTSNGWVELIDGVDPGRTVAVAGVFLLKSDVLRSKMGEGCAH